MQSIQTQRIAHHKALEALYKETCPSVAIPLGLNLWRKLRMVEQQASRWAIQYCNGEIDTAQMETFDDKIRISVARIFGNHSPAGFWYNKDPRGYALKLDVEKGAKIPDGMHKDWGGYGILAAEIE